MLGSVLENRIPRPVVRGPAALDGLIERTPRLGRVANEDAARRPGGLTGALIVILAHVRRWFGRGPAPGGASPDREPELEPEREPTTRPSLPDPLVEEAAGLRASLAALSAEHERLLASSREPRPASGGRIRRVLFGIGEPGTPGAALRSLAQAAVAGRAGIEARAVPVPDIGPDDIAGIDCLVLWRTRWSEHVAIMIGLVRDAGGLVAYDADDLFFDPALAQGPTIDGIRTTGLDRAEIAEFFDAMRQTAAVADLGLATTEPLAASLRRICRRVHVLPNGFDDRMLDAAQAAVAARAATPGDAGAPILIGYALGTRTHQRDFAVAAGAIAGVLVARPHARLVLFRTPDGPLLDLGEFPVLDRVGDRIEWRDLVPFDDLPTEIARFDIAICPLETGNPFVEAKSEIKFVEAALAGVPVVASPTDPFRRAIRDGITGFLAASAEEWHDRLIALIDDPDLRATIGRAAAASVLWTHGPKRRVEILSSIFRRHEAGAAGARDAELAIRRGAYAPEHPIALPATTVLFEHDDGARAEVAVALTSKDYGCFLEEALASIEAQTLSPLELVVVDDGSSDGSVEILLAWARSNRTRFSRIRIERTRRNSGLGPARNAVFAAARAPFVMSLDADNLLLPACCETLLALIKRADCAFAHSAIEQFGDAAAMLGTLPFDPARLVPSNYIDAMALVARWAWSAAGGYYDNPAARGWEDYDLWCRLAELGQFGVWHSEPLCRYRVHERSMTNDVTEQPSNKAALIDVFEHRHAWLRLETRAAHPRVALQDEARAPALDPGRAGGPDPDPLSDGFQRPSL